MIEIIHMSFGRIVLIEYEWVLFDGLSINKVIFGELVRKIKLFFLYRIPVISFYKKASKSK